MRQPFWQVGVVVQDIDAAIEELGAALGVAWSGPKERELDGLKIRVAFAMTGPPYLELIEGPPGSVWDATDGPHVHHIGFWSDDKDADGARLESAGLTREQKAGYAHYYRGKHGGTRIELVGNDFRPAIAERWQLPTESDPLV